LAGKSAKPPQTSNQPATVAGGGAQRPGFPVNYCNDTFPLLSLAYAIYCGRNQQGTFMEIEGNLARKSFRTVPGFTTPPPPKAIVTDPHAYKGYLDFYLGPGFRKRGGQIVSEDVPVNKNPLWVAALDRTSPSLEQCKEYVDLVMLELRGVPLKPGEGAARPNVQRPPRKNASRDDFRPLLSCLSVIFLNDDPTFRANPKAFLEDFEIDPAVSDVLEAYAGRLAKSSGTAPRPCLTEDEARVIAPKLAAEISVRATDW
jgi:hypothetical protein